MKITRKDPFSGKENTLELDITEEQLRSWQSGTSIQDAFPHLSADEREFILTGITTESWDVFVNENTEEQVVVLKEDF